MSSSFAVGYARNLNTVLMLYGELLELFANFLNAFNPVHRRTSLVHFVNVTSQRCYRTRIPPAQNENWFVLRDALAVGSLDEITVVIDVKHFIQLAHGTSLFRRPQRGQNFGGRFSKSRKKNSA